jgi:hypothetical protein
MRSVRFGCSRGTGLPHDRLDFRPPRERLLLDGVGCFEFGKAHKKLGDVVSEFVEPRVDLGSLVLDLGAYFAAMNAALIADGRRQTRGG